MAWNPTTPPTIGDSEEKDLCSANDAVLKGILVDRDGESPSIAGPRVANLKGILPLLDD